MAVVVEGIVRDLGDSYAEGTPRLEIHVPMKNADGLPFQTGERVQVQLHVAGVGYQAGLRSTPANKYAWVCPDVYATGGDRLTLGRVLTDAGFRANEKVQLCVDGFSLIVQRLGYSRVGEDDP